jgi:hypothetical protein
MHTHVALPSDLMRRTRARAHLHEQGVGSDLGDPIAREGASLCRDARDESHLGICLCYHCDLRRPSLPFT